MGKYYGLILMLILGSNSYGSDRSAMVVDTSNYAHIYINDSLISQGFICEIDLEQFSVNDTLIINYYTCTIYEPVLLTAGVFPLEKDKIFQLEVKEMLGNYKIKTDRSWQPFIITIPITDLKKHKKNGTDGIQVAIINEEKEIENFISIVGLGPGILTKFQIGPPE